MIGSESDVAEYNEETLFKICCNIPTARHNILITFQREHVLLSTRRQPDFAFFFQSPNREWHLFMCLEGKTFDTLHWEKFELGMAKSMSDAR
jgi:hypothetical protein